MADVVSTLRGWSATPASNLPAGTTTIGTNLDDNLREIQAVIRKYYSSAGSNMASAATVDLSTADGYYIQVTGTTTITALGTESAGISYLLRFTGSLKITHNSTSLICPGGASIYTKAGDVALVISEGSGNWRIINYQRIRQVGDVYLTDFGTLGAGNDATIMQAAVDFVQGTVNAILIEGNATVALGTTGITATGGIKLKGSSRERVTISWTGTTMFAFTIACDEGCHFEGITFSGPSGGTAGGAISLSGGGVNANSRSKVKDCTFLYGHRTLYFPDAYAWTVSGCTFSGAILYGIYVGCTTDVDAGDSIFEGNTMANLGASCSAIYQVSSGGLRVINNKLNGGAYGYLMDLAAGASTSILIFANNSVENQTTNGLRMVNSAGTGSFTHTVISDNMFANQPIAINLNESGSCFSLCTITGNSISGTAAGSTALINVGVVPRTVVKGNNLYGQGTATVGITIGVGCTTSEIGENLINGCVTDVADATSNTIASAAALAIPSGKDVFYVSGTTNITSITAATTHRQRKITLVFADVLTFTDGNNLKLAGSFTTATNASITLACADGTNWVEVSRSTN